MLPVVKNSTSLNLGEEDFAVSTPTHEELKESYDQLRGFSNSSNAKPILADIIFQKRLNKFEVKMTHVLDHVKSLKIDEEQLQSIFIMVLQSATDYLHHTEPAKISQKTELIIKLLKPFTKDDAVMCKQLIKFVDGKIKPATFWRRNRNSIKKFAYVFLDRVFSLI